LNKGKGEKTIHKGTKMKEEKGKEKKLKEKKKWD